MKNKELFIFDLDDTLTESKVVIDDEMVDILAGLLSHKQVAIISGAWLPQLKLQVLEKLPQRLDDIRKSRLHIFPTSGAAFYRFENGDWCPVYELRFTDEEKSEIVEKFSDAISKSEIEMPGQIYGERLQDRDTQLTFSALGSEAPLELKKTWDPDRQKRTKVHSIVKELLPQFDIAIAGKTSIDVLRKGVDKAFGVEMMEKHIGILKSEMIFFGDALFETGNDFPVVKTGIECVEVKDHEHTKRILKDFLQNIDGDI